MSLIEGLSYVARQGFRVAWYMGHAAAARDLGRSSAPPANPGRRSAMALGGLGEDVLALFRRDLRNAAMGLYPTPRDGDPLPTLLARSRAFFADVPEAARRKAEARGNEVYSDALAAELPAYFLQNFHFQSGGYLTEESARLYDTQVEVLFQGSANAMRRQCLVPLAAYLRGKDQRRLRLLDVGCGTGRFLRFVREAFPRLDAMGTDLSAAYLDEARRHLAPYTAHFESANAEALPFPDLSFDVLTSIYLFHEVTPEVRRRIAAEFARLLRPGGRLIFMDSLQLGDVPRFDPLLASFPRNFHEPYFESYLEEDLAALFAAAGLRPLAGEPVFLSKLVVADKPL